MWCHAFADPTSAAHGTVWVPVKARQNRAPQRNRFQLRRTQLAELFGRHIKTTGKHVNNALSEELANIPVVAKFATVGIEGSREGTRDLERYNLDMILSVGYRVKSKESGHFCGWGSNVLRRYLTEGVADVLAEYVPGLTLLRDYEQPSLNPQPHAVSGWELTLEEARQVI